MSPTLHYIPPPHLDGADPEEKRREIKHYFQQCYRRYEALFETVTDERAYFQKADPLRHPLIFYYGHTAVFFINKLKLAKLIDTRVDPHMESIFAVGVDEMSWDDLNEKHYAWPTLKETTAYRERVFTLVSELIENLPLQLPVSWESPWWVIMMGIEHENIHLETSSVLIRQLPLEMVSTPSTWSLEQESGAHPENSLVRIPSGNIHLGKARDDLSYGWDNEYGRHQAYLPSFSASKYLVSNGEYLEFVLSGGYENDRFWDEEGMAWRDYAKVTHPRFWIQHKSGYRLRTMTEVIPLPMSWPVEINALEAEAFCRWKSHKEGRYIRLPTEDEYMQLYAYSDTDRSDANIALRKSLSPVPVDRYEHGGGDI